LRSGVVVTIIVFVLFASAVPVFAAEPSLDTILNGLGFTNRNSVTLEIFPKGTYSVTMYAEYAGWKDTNQLKWYKAGTSVFDLIFDGPEGVPPSQPMGMVSPPITKSFTSDDTFGLCLNTNDGIDYSETSRNADGYKHVQIYQSGTDPSLYYIGFENMNSPGSDFDFNDMVLSLKHIQAYLTVNSAYNSPSPTSGWFDIGTSITASVSSPFSGLTGTRYVCTGWTGTGDVPVSGSDTAVSFKITKDSSITWNWKTQYLLTVDTDPSGLVPSPSRDPDGDAGPLNGWWYDDGVPVALSSQSVTGFVFLYWDVDGSPGGNGVESITVNMNADHVAISHYVPLYGLTIISTVGGTTDPSPGSYTRCSGSTVSVKVTVYNGYVFGHWELDASNVGSGSPYSVLMNADHTLKAFFDPIPVGGEWIPVNNSELLAPLLAWVLLASVFIVPFVCVRRNLKRER
jgi:hypothetical protein